MTRLFALLAAILVSAIAVTSACAASGLEPIHFRIDTKRNSGDVAATFFSGGRNHNEWSTEFTASQLAGLNLAALRAGNEQQVRFAIVRDAGRLDCKGTGARSTASGDCDFRANPDFINFLASRGIQRPSDDQAFSMMSLDVRRETVDALHAAHYPVPTVEDLLSLTALGVDSRYIKGLAQVGYRPSDLDTLVQFKALDITPAYIQGFVRHGLANMPTDDLVQLKALGIDGDYVASFEQAGYRNLSADQLVQLKALGVTADYARSVRRGSAQLPTPDRLVELKALGFDPR
jgi:hypothetical protein